MTGLFAYTNNHHIIMNDITQIKAALLSAAPGTTIEILNYRDSEGVAKDIRVELLSPEAYAAMQAEDLKRLREAKVDDDLAASDRGDLQLVDLIAARAQLIESREKSTQAREEGSGGSRGAEYHMISPNVATLPTSDTALYLMRLKSLQEPGMPKPAKGSVPRAKQELTRWLNLPTRYYIHTLKLEPGKFETLRITREVVLPPAL